MADWWHRLAISSQDLILIFGSYAALWTLSGYLWLARNPSMILPPMHPEHFSSVLYWRFTNYGLEAGVVKGFPAMKVRVVRGLLVAATVTIQPISPLDPRLNVGFRPAATTLLLLVPVVSIVVGWVAGSVLGFYIMMGGLTLALAFLICVPVAALGFAAQELIPLIREPVYPNRPERPQDSALGGAVPAVSDLGAGPAHTGPPRDPLGAWLQEERAKRAAAADTPAASRPSVGGEEHTR
jgi:hypothetical protein